MGNPVLMDSSVGIVSKCILTLTLPASGCTDARQTLLQLTSFFPLETESKQKRLIPQREDKRKTK